MGLLCAKLVARPHGDREVTHLPSQSFYSRWSKELLGRSEGKIPTAFESQLCHVLGPVTPPL